MRLALGRALLALGRQRRGLRDLARSAQLAPAPPTSPSPWGSARRRPVRCDVTIRPSPIRPSIAAHLHLARLGSTPANPTRPKPNLPPRVATMRMRCRLPPCVRRSQSSRAQPLVVAYVRHLSINSPRYDERCAARLGYAAPETLRIICALLLGAAGKKPTSSISAGHRVKRRRSRLSKRLFGVDLSPGMLGQKRGALRV